MVSGKFNMQIDPKDWADRAFYLGTYEQSLVHLITTDEMRRRVMSVYNCAFRGGMPLGNLVSGWLVPLFTAPVVLTANGLLLIAVALYFLLVHRRVTAL